MKDENGDWVGNKEGSTKIYHWKSIFLAFWFWITYVLFLSKDRWNAWIFPDGFIFDMADTFWPVFSTDGNWMDEGMGIQALALLSAHAFWSIHILL